MRVKDTVWQGCFGDWQPLFIHEYWLPLGQVAWQGFLQQGRGIVVCEVYGVSAAVDWSCTPVAYAARFVAQSQLAHCGIDLALEAEQGRVVDAAVATYDPAQDAILLLLADSRPYITCLKGWAVPPPECFRQMGNRQGEFTHSDPSQTQ